MLLRCYYFAGRRWQYSGPSWSCHQASSKAQSQLKLCPPHCSGLHNGDFSFQKRLLQSERPSGRPLEIGNDKASPVHDLPQPFVTIDPPVAGSESHTGAERTWSTTQDRDEHSIQQLTLFQPLLKSQQSQDAGKDDSSQISNQDSTSSQTIAPTLRSSYASPRRLAKIRKDEEHHQVKNRHVKYKSDLSHDWRQPLDLLKQSTRLSKDGNLTIQCAPGAGSYESTKLFSPQANLNQRIQEPAQWSPLTLTQYVRDLILYKPPRALVWRLSNIKSGAEQPHQVAEIGEILDVLLHKKSMRKHLTSEACQLAMAFFSRKGMVSKARKLFLLIEHRSIDLGTPAMNAMMRKAAHEKDLFVFTWLLQIMIRRGLSPDALTWDYFIRCVEYPGVRRTIWADFQRMFPSISPTIRLRFLRTTVRDQVGKYLEKKSKLEPLFTDLQDRHGPLWLSGRMGTLIGNEIIREMLSRISGNDMLQMVEEMTKHGFVPHQVTMLLLVHQCLRLRFMEDALKLTEYFHTRWSMQPGRSVHDLLAKYAWRHQLLNVGKLVWTSACFKGFVSWKLQSRVAWSLRINAAAYSAQEPADPDSPSGYQPLEGLVEPKKLFSFVAGEFLLALPPLEPHSLETVKAAMGDNLARAGKFKLEPCVAKSLLQAYAVDRQWAVWRGEDIAAKLQHPWPIDFKPTDQAPEGGYLGDEGKKPRIWRVATPKES